MAPGRGLFFGALCLLAALAGGGLGMVGDRLLAERAELRALDVAAARLVDQVEMSIDHAITEMTTLREMSIMDCDSTALSASRDMLMSRATFKDIAVFASDGSLRCRANSANLNDQRTPVIEAEAGGFGFGLPEGMPEGVLSVRWPAGERGSLSALIGVDSFLFSFFPAQYRDQSSVSIMLAGGHVLSSFGDPRSIGNAGLLNAVEKASSRYPLSVSLLVPKAALSAVAVKETGLITAVAAILSALAAALAIWQFTRPPNPVAVLKAAIERGEIRPYFQPVVSARSNLVTGCEVLARWVKPDGTVISPDRFIPIAENSGLICALTERLLRDAVSELGATAQTQNGFKLAINVSPVHFLKDDFVASLLSVSHEAGLPPANLVIELTERQNIADFAMATHVAETLRASGVRLSIDDVGTGHNGLSTLQDMPGDIIKIDKRFVDTVIDNPLSAVIIDMLVALARQLGRTTVAEGVETAGQALAVAARGVDELQGYHYAKPMPADAFRRWCEVHAGANRTASHHRSIKRSAA